jgi:hypothetical protein
VAADTGLYIQVAIETHQLEAQALTSCDVKHVLPSPTTNEGTDEFHFTLFLLHSAHKPKAHSTLKIRLHSRWTNVFFFVPLPRAPLCPVMP